MSTYVPKHMRGRAGRLNGARTSVTALSASRSAVAMGVAGAVPFGAAAVLAAPALADQGAPGASSQDGAPQRVLAYGANGDDVAQVQGELALVRDGAFGPVTTAAIKDFQRANNLDVDGVVGAETWAALQGSGITSQDGVLAQGSTGPLVRAVQKKLGVTVDGVYGDVTEAAVTTFQKNKGLDVDGVVGVDTTYALAQVSGAAVSSSKSSSSKAASSKSDASARASRSKTAPAKKAPVKAAPAKPTLVDPSAMYELPFPAGYAARISQGPFGSSSHHKVNDKHHVDFAVPTGTPIVASASGVVYRTENNVTGGKAVYIRDASGYCMEYAHLSSINVSQGQRVSQGQGIALSGATGHVTGAHLHWGIIDCSSYTSIRIADTKEAGTTYTTGSVLLSRND